MGLTFCLLGWPPCRIVFVMAANVNKVALLRVPPGLRISLGLEMSFCPQPCLL